MNPGLLWKILVRAKRDSRLLPLMESGSFSPKLRTGEQRSKTAEVRAVGHHGESQPAWIRDTRSDATSFFAADARGNPRKVEFLAIELYDRL